MPQSLYYSISFSRRYPIKSKLPSPTCPPRHLLISAASSPTWYSIHTQPLAVSHGPVGSVLLWLLHLLFPAHSFSYPSRHNLYTASSRKSSGLGQSPLSGLAQVWCFPLHDIHYSFTSPPTRLRAPYPQARARNRCHLLSGCCWRCPTASSLPSSWSPKGRVGTEV